MEANTMFTDQTAPKGSGSILFAIYATKGHKQMREQMTIAVNDGKRVNPFL